MLICQQGQNAHKQLLLLATQHRRMEDGVASRLCCYFTHWKHTHTSIERECKIERGREGEAGCVLAVGCSFFSKAVTYTCALYLLAQGFYVVFLVPSAACRASPNFVDLSNYREAAKGPDRIKMDADITSNHIRKIDKAKAERWVK